MNRQLRNLVLGACSLDSTVAAQDGPDHPLLACTRVDAGSVARAAATLQRETEKLGVPEVDAAQRQRLGRIDGVSEAEQAIVGAVALIDAEEVARAAGVDAEEVGELCNRRLALEGVQEAAAVVARCAADTQHLLAGLLVFLDEEVQALVAQDLASDRLTEAEKQALLADMAPRLKLLEGEALRQAQVRARQGQVLGRLQRQAEEAEAETAARRTIAALRAGEPVSPEEVAAALRWRRRQEEGPAPGPSRRTRR